MNGTCYEFDGNSWTLVHEDTMFWFSGCLNNWPQNAQLPEEASLRYQSRLQLSRWFSIFSIVQCSSPALFFRPFPLVTFPLYEETE